MVTIYSFEEIVNFLNDRFPLLKFEELKSWLKDIRIDEELAMKVAEVVEEESRVCAKWSRPESISNPI